MCAGLCQFVLVYAGLCCFVPQSRFLRADRFLAPFFRRLKKIVNKKGATGFKVPLSPRKKMFLVSSL
jgi:hypothetical protein